jgi:hypothetical protein
MGGTVSLLRFNRYLEAINLPRNEAQRKPKRCALSSAGHPPCHGPHHAVALDQTKPLSLGLNFLIGSGGLLLWRLQMLMRPEQRKRMKLYEGRIFT